MGHVPQEESTISWPRDGDRKSPCAGLREVGRGFKRQGDPDRTAVGRSRFENGQLAMVRFDDLAAYGQTQTQTDVSRGIKRLRHLLHRLRGKSRAAILNVQVNPRRPMPVS